MSQTEQIKSLRLQLDVANQKLKVGAKFYCPKENAVSFPFCLFVSLRCIFQFPIMVFFSTWCGRDLSLSRLQFLEALYDICKWLSQVQMADASFEQQKREEAGYLSTVEDLQARLTEAEHQLHEGELLQRKLHNTIQVVSTSRTNIVNTIARIIA